MVMLSLWQMFGGVDTGSHKLFFLVWGAYGIQFLELA